MFFNKSDEINEEDLIPLEDFERLEQLVNVHQDYLDNLYVFYQLKPTRFLENIRNLSYELLRFFDNVCQENDLEYWMDYSTLLGAVRHGNFIPWDDDLDIGMMRQDYIELCDLFQSKIDDYDLRNVVCTFKQDQKSKRWLQISYQYPDFDEKLIGINIFPYDFVDGEAIDDLDEKYNELKSKPEDIDSTYSKLNLTFDMGEYYIPGIEGIHGKDERFKFKLRQTEHLFPLLKLPFGKYEFFSPNDSLSYAKKIYGKKFISIPRKKPKNQRLLKFRKVNNIEEIFKKESNHMKKINDNYGI